MNEKPDLSKIISILGSSSSNGNLRPEELMATLINHSSSSSQENDSSSSNDSTSSTQENANEIPDMEMMMKLMQAMKSSRQDNPSKKLLQSLKPFLNDARKKKVDQYIQLLGMTKAIEMMQSLGDVSK